MLVSVIIPTFNRPHYLENALKSVYNQTFTDLEAIVINDGGTPPIETIEKARAWGLPINLVNLPQNSGAAVARNAGIKAAKGKYISYLDDDDLFFQKHIETHIRYLENTPFKVTYSHAYRAFQRKIDGQYQTVKRDIPYREDFNYRKILFSNFIPTLCIVHAKECLETCGYFDESFKRLEDWELWLRMSRHFPFFRINGVTCEFSWRNDGTSVSISDRSPIWDANRQIEKKHRSLISKHPSAQAVWEKAALKECIETKGIRVDYYRILSDYENDCDLKKGFRFLESKLRLNPLNPYYLNDLAVLYRFSQQNNKSANTFTRALGIASDNFIINRNASTFFEEINNFEKAKDIVKNYLKINPSSQDMIIFYGDLLCRHGDTEEAENIYRHLLKPIIGIDGERLMPISPSSEKTYLVKALEASITNFPNLLFQFWRYSDKAFRYIHNFDIFKSASIISAADFIPDLCETIIITNPLKPLADPIQRMPNVKSKLFGIIDRHATQWLHECLEIYQDQAIIIQELPHLLTNYSELYITDSALEFIPPSLSNYFENIPIVNYQELLKRLNNRLLNFNKINEKVPEILSHSS